MSGILLTMGPIATHASFVRQGPIGLRWINKDQFIKAARQLESLNLGHYDSTIAGGIFFKKKPDDIKADLEVHQDLASVDDYALRYALRVPASVGPRVKEALIMGGHLLETQFK